MAKTSAGKYVSYIRVCVQTKSASASCAPNSSFSSCHKHYVVLMQQGEVSESVKVKLATLRTLNRYSRLQRLTNWYTQSAA